MPLGSILEEAGRIQDEAEGRGLTLKLFGGVAVYTRCPSARKPPLERKYVDIDLMGYSKQTKGIRKMFPELGYSPRDKFNAMYGDRRLIFNDAEHDRRVDVFLDVFEMCHRFDMKERLGMDGTTISPSDLLVTKLQVVEANEKDFKDITCILIDHEVGGDGHSIEGEYVARLCGSDWGIYKTLTMNLDRAAKFVPTLGIAQVELVSDRIQKLKGMIEDEPKSLKWKLRARVGERAQWYVLPEADKEIVDSRLPENPG